MTALRLQTRPRPRATPFLLLGAAATLGLLVWGFLDAGVAGAGWLTGITFWIGLPLGALALRATHALTGGKWGYALRPALDPLMAALPGFLLLFLPLLLVLPAVYPWAAEPDQAGPGVAALYLNTPGYVVRGAVALVGWSILAFLLRGPAPGRLLAALALVFHALAISLLPIDWTLSIAPRFTSSAFGAAVAMGQMLLALAFAAVLGMRTGGHGEESEADLGGLLLAGLLMVIYLEFMQYLVAWYGNLPEKAKWYGTRGELPWRAVLLFSFIPGAVLPFLALLPTRLRQSAAACRVIGLLILLGLMARQIWLVAPEHGGWAIVSGMLGLLAVGGLLLGVALGPVAARLEGRGAAASAGASHGR